MIMSPREHAQQFLEFICPDGGIRELRVFSSESTPEKKIIWAGQFDRLSKMANSAVQLSDKYRAEAVYYSLNSIKPERSPLKDRNIIFKRPSHTVKGPDIATRDIYLIDCDPHRPKGTSATDAEKARATFLAQMVAEYLNDQGFPEPIVLDSGNGGALLYRGSGADPEASQYEWSQCLLHLTEQFADFAGASVDKAVHDPNRISRMPGTWNRKGESTPERPHRMAQVISYPATWEPVQINLLRNLGAKGRSDVAAGRRDAPSSVPALKVSSKKLQRVLQSLLTDLIEGYPETFELHKVVERPDGIYIGLAKCPFKNDEHTGQLVGVSKSCIIIDKQTAQIGFKCFSDDCAEHGFGDLMRLIYDQYDEQPIFSYCEEILPFVDEVVPYIRYVRESPWGWPLNARVNTMDLAWEDIEEKFTECAMAIDRQLWSVKRTHRQALHDWAERVMACQDLDAAASLMGQGMINCIAFPSSGPLTDEEVDAFIREIEHPHPVELKWVA